MFQRGEKKRLNESNEEIGGIGLIGVNTSKKRVN